MNNFRLFLILGGNYKITVGVYCAFLLFYFF